MSNPDRYRKSLVDRYLLPHERTYISVRQHPAMLLPVLTTAVGGLLAAIVVSIVSGGTEVPKLAAWILAAFLILRFIWAVPSWFVQLIVVTPQRFILISGITSHKITSFELPDLKKLTAARSFAGRILGYGSYRIGPDGADQLVINYVPYSEQLTLEINGMLYKDNEMEPE
jgi:hypothetical protein